MHYDERAYETTKTWTIGSQHHRHVAGEVHCADGIRIVVEVRRMKTCLTAVLPCPFWPRTDESHACAVRVVMHFPLSGEQRLNVFMCEKIRRAMWAVHDTDFPIVRVVGNFRCRKRAGRTHQVCLVTPAQHVAGPKRTAGVAAEFAKNECRSAGEICRYVESAAYSDVGPRTRVGCCTKL